MLAFAISVQASTNQALAPSLAALPLAHAGRDRVLPFSQVGSRALQAREHLTSIYIYGYMHVACPARESLLSTCEHAASSSGSPYMLFVLSLESPVSRKAEEFQ